MPRLSATKVRNALLREDDSLRIDLKDVRVNGAHMGCSGYVSDPNTGTTIYLTTDILPVAGRHDDVLYRYVASANAGHSGTGTNQYATDASYTKAICDALGNVGQRVRELGIATAPRGRRHR